MSTKKQFEQDDQSSSSEENLRYLHGLKAQPDTRPKEKPIKLEDIREEERKLELLRRRELVRQEMVAIERRRREDAWKDEASARDHSTSSAYKDFRSGIIVTFTAVFVELFRILLFIFADFIVLFLLGILLRDISIFNSIFEILFDGLKIASLSVIIVTFLINLIITMMRNKRYMDKELKQKDDDI